MKKARLLTQARLRELLFYDPGAGYFMWRVSRGKRRAGAVAGRLHSEGYVEIKIDGKSYFAHRLAWFYVKGEWPPVGVDHRGGIRDDNRFKELRKATTAENMQNLRKARSNTGVIGVHWREDRQKYQAQIGKNGTSKNLGHYSTLEEANRAYRKAKKALHTFNPELSA